MDFQDAVKVRKDLNRFLYEFRDCVKTRPSRNHLGVYVRGQVSDLARKSIEPMALDAGVEPRTLQEFLSYHRWDHEAVRVRAQEILQRDHGSSEAIGVIDETTCPKKGDKTVGVKRQHCGATGKLDNCVATVHLGFVSGNFHALADSDIFLPQEWMEDAERREEAKIPEDLVFRTKPQIAMDEIDRVRSHGVHLKWIVADELYGRGADWRNALAKRGLFYGVEIPCSLTGWTKQPSLIESAPRGEDSGTSPKLRVAPGERAPKRVDSLWKRGGPSWERFRVKETGNGPEVWDVRTTPFYPNEDGLPGAPVLLIIAENVLTGERKYFLAHAPAGTPTETILYVIFSRWHIERIFEDCKGEIGMDHFEVRNYVSLTRHLVLSMVSILYLVKETDRLKKKIPNLRFAKCAPS